MLTKGAAFTGFATSGGIVFQWQLRGAQDQEPRAESRGEGGGDGTGKQPSHCRHQHAPPSCLSSNLDLAQSSFCSHNNLTSPTLFLRGISFSQCKEALAVLQTFHSACHIVFLQYGTFFNKVCNPSPAVSLQ